MIKINKFMITLMTTVVICVGNSYAMESNIDEEQSLIAKRQQVIKEFLDSEENLWQEFHKIESLKDVEKLYKLREFGFNNLNTYKSVATQGPMYDIFYLFAKDHTFIRGAEPIEEQLVTKMRNKLTNDFGKLKTMGAQNHLKEGSFPVGEYWNPHQNFQRTSEIEITHGGGAFYLLNCFDNKALGYGLERGGIGLQVHPHCVEFNNEARQRGPEYAYKAMRGSLDFPAILTGTVQAQYLMPADNDYEAAIKISDLIHIKNPRITLASSDSISTSMGYDYGVHAKEFYKLLPQTLIDCLESFNNRTD